MKKLKTISDKLNQLARINSYLTKEQYFVQLNKIISEYDKK